MKIDLVCGSLSGGGAQRVMVLLANKFAEEGHEANIITFNKREDYLPSPLVGRVRLNKKEGLSSTFRCMYKLFTYYLKKSNRPDILVSFIVTTNFKSIPVAKMFGIKIIACEHNNHLAKYPKLAHYARKYLYRHANIVTVLTAFDVPFYKNLKAKVSVMPNPATFNKFVEPMGHSRANEIIAVGNLDRYGHKGFDNLLHLVAPILKANKEWTLRLIGSGDKGKTFLTGLAKQMDVEEQISFEGFKSNVDAYLRQGSIFILSSRYEGLPMVLIEAMSQGMACISYDCISGPSEIIDHNVDGLLVEDQNQQEMQKGLQMLIANAQLRKELGHRAVEKVDKFNIDTIYLKWQTLFNEVLNP